MMPRINERKLDELRAVDMESTNKIKAAKEATCFTKFKSTLTKKKQ